MKTDIKISILLIHFAFSCVADAATWRYSGFLYGDQSTTSYDTIPTDITSPRSDIKIIAAEAYRSTALTNSGDIIVWGNSNFRPELTPTGLIDVVGMSPTGSLLLKEDGKVARWESTAGAESTLSNIIKITNTLALKNNGTVININNGTLVSGLSNAVDIASGSKHSLALKSDGTIKAWGQGTAVNVPLGLTEVISIAAGGYHSVALKKNGQVVAWGSNYEGQCNPPSELADVIAIAAGERHTVALKRDGTVAAWGDNSNGQSSVPNGINGVIAISAGIYQTIALTTDGTVVGWGNLNASTPPMNPLTGLNTVAPGLRHTLAIREDGNVVAWGRNSEGQTTVPPGLSDIVAVAAGDYHSLAVRANGTVAAWGRNDIAGYYYGQATVPQGLTDVVAVAAGIAHSAALKSDGTVVAWGSNNLGQRTVSPGLSGVIKIAASHNHTVALKSDGKVVAWGSVYENGNLVVPISVPENLSDVIAIATGMNFVMALKSDGTVVAWGSTSEFSGYQPVYVPGNLVDVTAIAACDNVLVALKRDGTITAWGNTWFNTYCESKLPVGLTKITSISAGGGVIFYTTSADMPPMILQVGNVPIPAVTGTQPVIIQGSNFHPDCTVTLRDHRTGEIFRNRTKISQTPTSIGLSVNFTSTPAEWSAEVINPERKSSGLFRFQVGTTVIPGITVDQLIVSGSASSMNSGETTALTATLHYLDGTEKDVTDSAIFRVVGTIPEGVSLVGNELRTESSTLSTTVILSASFETTSGGIASASGFSVIINRGFGVKIFSVIPDDPFTMRATTSLSEIGGSYTYTWDFNGDGIFNDGQDNPWATHTYPTMTGEHIVKVRVTKNSTGEVASAEKGFRRQKALAFNQPLSPAPVNVAGLGPLYDKNGAAPFQFDSNRIQNGFILLTHGLESSGSAGWLKDLAQKIEGAITNSLGFSFLPNIAIYDWEKDANPYKLDLVFGVGVRDTLAITSAGKTNGGYLANWFAAQENVGFIDKNAPIHFIGHSAGGFVMGQLAANLNQAGWFVDRVTMLDTPMASPEHLRLLPSKGTYVERLVTSYWGSLNYPNVPLDNGNTNLIEYYESYLNASSNLFPNERGHGRSYRRYEATATVGHEDYLTRLGVSFWNSPFILGPRNSQKGASLFSLSDLAAELAPTDDQESPQSPQNVDSEQLIDNLTSYGTVTQAAGQFTLIENSDTDSGVSTQIAVPLGAYAVSFLYQFQAGDESDRLVASAGQGAAQFIVPNLPLYRTQQFEGSIGVAALGQSTITLDFRLDGMGTANSSVIISAIKFLISDDVDQDGVPNTAEVSLGTNPTKRDTDNDGLSDDEEINAYFTVPTEADTDSDGVTDGMEATAGTNPKSAVSAFRITEIAPQGNGDVRLAFPGAAGRTYRVRGSETPYGQTNWTIQSGVRATNGAASVIDPGRRNTFQRFFYWAEVEGID